MIYVFGKKMVDLDHAISSLLEVMSPTEDAAKILLKSDVIYSHLMGMPSLFRRLPSDSNFP